MTVIDPLSPAQLEAYCARIGYDGARRGDLATLRALHRAQVLAIPFENIDVQLGTPPGRDPQAIFAKLVERRRGGWCYELNGLLGRALAALNFEVVPLSAAVMRSVLGDQQIGTHLALKVRADGANWLVDAGFGSTHIAPLPLAEHAWDQAPLAGDISRIEDGFWRMAITAGPGLLSYDFLDEPADPAQLDAKCAWQGTDPGSVFVQTLTVQQRSDDRHLRLQNTRLTETRDGAVSTHVIGSARELVEVLRTRFSLDVPEVARLWPTIAARPPAAG